MVTSLTLWSFGPFPLAADLSFIAAASLWCLFTHVWDTFLYVELLVEGATVISTITAKSFRGPNLSPRSYENGHLPAPHPQTSVLVGTCYYWGWIGFHTSELFHVSVLLCPRTINSFSLPVQLLVCYYCGKAPRGTGPPWNRKAYRRWAHPLQISQMFFFFIMSILSILAISGMCVGVREGASLGETKMRWRRKPV